MTTDAPFDRLAAMVILLTRKKKIGLWALNKLLWFADSAHLLLHGRTISGATYAFHGYGPTPREIHVVRRVLIRRALLREYVQEYECFRVFAYEAETGKIRYRVLKREFSASELKVIKAVTANLCGRPGTEIHAMYLQVEPWVGALSGDDSDRRSARAAMRLGQWMDSTGLRQSER